MPDVLQSTGGGDFFVPDVGQRIDQLGRVTYDFTGHVHALGLDLDEGTNGVGPATPADHRVQWLSAAGLRRSSVYDDGESLTLFSEAAKRYGAGAPLSSSVLLQADSGAGIGAAGLQVAAGQTAQNLGGSVGSAGVYLAVGGAAGPVVPLLDSDYRSHFVTVNHATRILYNSGGAGPAPSYTAMGGWGISQTGRFMFEFSATGWATAPGPIEVFVAVDGIEIAAARLYFNEANSHKTFPMAYGYADLAAGNHYWSWGTHSVGGPALLQDGHDSTALVMRRGGGFNAT